MINEKAVGYLERWHRGETAAALLAEAQDEYTRLGLAALSLSLTVEMFINQGTAPMDAKGMELARGSLREYRALTGMKIGDESG